MGQENLARSKKNARERRALIVFLDESGFSEHPSVRRSWAPRGQTPVLIHRHRKWSQLSAIGALGYRSDGRAKTFLWLHRGTVRSPEIVRFLKYLRRHVRRPVILLWDGLHAHRSRETTDYIQSQTHWLSVQRLPAYAPELNPVEGMWAWFKGGVTANLCPDGLDSLKAEVQRGRRRLARRGDLPVAFLAKSGLFL
jgi:transposase